MLRSFLVSLALVGLAAGAAGAQTQNVRLRGTVTAIDATSITVNTGTGSTKIALADPLRVILEEPAELAGIKPGDFVGSGAVPQPDGTQRALEVHIFAESMRGSGEGSRPWTGAPNGTMTNATVRDVAAATVDQVAGRVLTLDYKGGQQRLFVPPGTPIVRFEPGDRKALAVGVHVSINATKEPDGSLLAPGVTVGKNGFTPPL
jgi:hypothetical protein